MEGVGTLAVQATSEGSGHAVSVVLPSESIKPIVNLLIVLIVALFITLPPSIYAIVMVSIYRSEIDAKVDDLNWRYRQMAYWSQTLDANIEARGIKVEAPPILGREFEKKGKHQ